VYRLGKVVSLVFLTAIIAFGHVLPAHANQVSDVLAEGPMSDIVDISELGAINSQGDLLGWNFSTSFSATLPAGPKDRIDSTRNSVPTSYGLDFKAKSFGEAQSIYPGTLESFSRVLISDDGEVYLHGRHQWTGNPSKMADSELSKYDSCV